MVLRSWLENWGWSHTRISQLNPGPRAQYVPQSVSGETAISKSSAHKGFNVDSLDIAQQIVRISSKGRKCNSLKSSSFFEAHCLFWKTMKTHHCIVPLTAFIWQREAVREERKWEGKRKKPWSLSNAKSGSIESSNWWPQRGVKDLSPLFKSPVFAYLMT